VVMLERQSREGAHPRCQRRVWLTVEPQQGQQGAHKAKHAGERRKAGASKTCAAGEQILQLANEGLQIRDGEHSAYWRAQYLHCRNLAG
jgi:hypothetical protein